MIMTIYNSPIIFWSYTPFSGTANAAEPSGLYASPWFSKCFSVPLRSSALSKSAMIITRLAPMTIVAED